MSQIDSDYEYNMTDDEFRRYHYELQEKKELAEFLAAEVAEAKAKAAAAEAKAAAAAKEPPPKKAVVKVGPKAQELKNLNLSNVPQQTIMDAIEFLKANGAYWLVFSVY